MSETDGNNEAEAGGSTTMELNLRLDGDGRTTYDPAALRTDAGDVSSNKTATASDTSESCPKRAKLEQASPPKDRASVAVDYSSKTTLTNLASIDNIDTTTTTTTTSPSSPSLEKSMNDLLFDCEITDCGLLPRTFWIPCEGTEPRCYLEKLALEVFHHHVPTPTISNNNTNANANGSASDSNFYYDAATSGAEWWVQLRPSPEGAGRYSMLADPNDDCENDEDMTKSGISFHWDKDEDLRLMCGGSMYIHPHISTVTYLTDLGAPTMVVTKRVDAMSGQYVPDANEDGSAAIVEGLVSWPKRGKHLSFDGRYLHAAPSDLMKEGMFEKQCKYEVTDDMDEKTKKSLARSHRRVTFLVNIWLNYKPFNVNPFPETMIASLSKPNLFDGMSMFGNQQEEETKTKTDTTTKTVVIQEGKASIASSASDECKKSAIPDLDECKKQASAGSEVKLTEKQWSMGQKDEESIEVLMPLELVQSQSENGSDLALKWHDGVVLNGSGI